MTWDYHASQHSARAHPLEPLRAALQRQRLPDAAAVRSMKNGTRVRYAGLVICRQRPATAKGVVFMTLEDETGFVNVVLWQKVFDKFALLAKTEAFLGITGELQNQEGVTHLVAQQLWVPKVEQQPSNGGSRDFHWARPYVHEMRIAAVGRALPEHYYDQATLLRFLQGVWADDPAVARRLESLHDSVNVKGRYLALPIERYDELRTFGATNDAWIEQGLLLAERAVRDALGRAGLAPSAVDAIFFSSVTGIATPSLDARLVNRMGLRSDIKRIPMFGLGCVGGAAAVARAADYVRAFPDQVVVVLMVELCSLTLQRKDRSAANLVSVSLFGDGAGAAVIVGAERDEGDGPQILATKSVFYEETEDLMGWRISEDGFRIVLSTEVPAVAQQSLAGDVDAFLAEHGVAREDIRSWVCHPGGPKVLTALQDGLGLDRRDLDVSWRHLERMGNLSSASVLLILEDTIRDHRPPPRAHGIMLAMGPAFCSELLLLQW